MAEHRRIVQVLNNLFANAARHAPESSSIRVSAVREGVHVAVSVADEGLGVAPELLPRLFDRHAGAAEGKTPTGHGLGLAICKGLVEAHGGRIRAQSDGPGRAGYAPLVTGEPGDLAQIIRSEKPRLVLLDLVLPGRDGIELMESVPELSDLPVIFISGYGRDETVAAALEAGAADYIVKPFSPTELVARVRAALRRHEAPEPFTLGALAIDYDRRRVTVEDEPVTLTATEFELLRVLALNAGRVLTYDTLLRRVWGSRNGADANLVRIFVRNLRLKLGDDAASPTYIFNERGVGYRMVEPGDE